MPSSPELLEKVKLLPLVEPITLARRIRAKLVANDWPETAGRERKLIINHHYKFLYCPIHKVASSSMLKAMLLLSESWRKESLMKSSRTTIRLYIDLNYSLCNYSYKQARQYIQDDYFKFVIVRNPWARLVSTYLQFFVRLLPGERYTGFAIDTAKRLYGSHSYQKMIDTITFDDFVRRYVVETEDAALNPHCRPQYLFLGDVVYDFVGKMENLNTDLEKIAKALDASFIMPNVNKTIYADKVNGFSCAEDCSKIPTKELRKISGGFPDFKAFYTEELVDMVRHKFSKDIEMFEYDYH